MKKICFILALVLGLSSLGYSDCVINGRWSDEITYNGDRNIGNYPSIKRFLDIGDGDNVNITMTKIYFRNTDSYAIDEVTIKVPWEKNKHVSISHEKEKKSDGSTTHYTDVSIVKFIDDYGITERSYKIYSDVPQSIYRRVCRN